MKSKCNSKIFLYIFLIASLSSCGSKLSESSSKLVTIKNNSKADSTVAIEQTATIQARSAENAKKSKEELVSDVAVNKKEKSTKANVTLNWPWRGITIVSHAQDSIDFKDIDKLASYGVNLIRLRLSFRVMMKRENIDYEAAYKKTIEWAKRIIKVCDKYNIDVLISHSDFPIDHSKNLNQSSPDFWGNSQELKIALNTISSIVEAFKDEESVKAFQFLAEPLIVKNGKSITPENWLSFFEQIIQATRKKSNKYILFSPGPGGKTAGYQNLKKPFADTTIIYNFHYYEPHAYTHQHIKENNTSYRYPGMINYRQWNKNKIEERIKMFTDWKLKHNITYGFVGEFSVVRWAENKETYLKDVLDLFEKYNLGYAYFSYNGWLGWNYNYEHNKSTDFNGKSLIYSNKETATLKLLKEYWIKNKSK